ncbi:MAG: cell division protein FtsL [Methylophilaceae bacterium]|nr:cell division protein FtsL [Methylophilaceae bacterium]MBL6726982.1 cell division protein FtsL [Methylophilaceae bacterium]MBL6728836.1 cell division protein FtsL [Methylophilaceae bacterium]MBL6790945.1 cell division protein FtsL [Methylophilaceae bacterium]
MRLNLILFGILIIFSLTLVNSEHQYRNNYSQLDQENKKTFELRDEQTKLQIEESEKSSNDRIKEIATKKLGMFEPKKSSIRVIK